MIKKILTLTLFFSFLTFLPLYAKKNKIVEKKTVKITQEVEKISEEEKKYPPIKVLYANEPAIIMDGIQITIGEAIRTAIQRNHDIITGSYEVAMASSDYEKFQKKYSTFLAADSSLKHSKYPNSLAAYTGENETKITTSAALQKMFSSGTTFSGGIKHEYSSKKGGNTPIPTNGGDSFYMVPPGTTSSHQPILFASVKQELLKNSFGYSDRRLEKMLKNIGEMKKAQTISGLSGIVVSVIADYWAMVTKRTALDNAILKLKETRKVRAIVRQNIKYGLSEKFELNYYNALVAGAEATVEISKKEFRDARRDIILAANLKDSTMIGNTVILKNSAPKINTIQALSDAYEKRADYLSNKLQLKNAKLQKEIYTNDALPSLTAEVIVSSMANDESIGSAYGDTATANSPAIEGKIALTYPLDDAEQKTNSRNGTYQLKQAKVQLNKTKIKIKHDVTSAIENINTSYNLYNKLKKARIEAAASYYKLLRSMRKGRFSAATVKTAQDAYLDSKQRELESLIGYNISFLQFEITKNTLFEKFNIDVNKYIPKG